MAYARQATVIAARAFSLQPIDLVCVERSDDKLLEECKMGWTIGFRGKQAIHPDQIETIQRTFQPSRDKIREAVRILEAGRLNEERGQGAFTLDGIVVDRPVIKAAANTVVQARKLGLLM